VAKVVVINHMTLDGVMQAPGRVDEDTRGGFTYGGWAARRIDDVVNQALAARFPRSGVCCSGGAATRTCSVTGTPRTARSKTC
jgi:hypothetical protein